MRQPPHLAHRLPRVSRVAIAALLAIATGLPPLAAQSSSGDFSSGAPRVESANLTPILVYFPPHPPPLGRAIARTTPPAGRGAAPPELAAYVNELFYPALGTRLTTKTLNAKLRAQLDQYRAAKTALVTELRTELDRWRDTDAISRATALTAFAPKQTARINELETTAEQLRRDLIASDQSWTALRQWRLGDKDRRGFSPFEIAQVMRGYAFYQAGLLPAQRRLLREISIELYMAGEDTNTATTQQPYLFFPPEPARVLLPDDIPAEVATKIAAYQTKKSVLKKELYDAVHAHDGQRLTFFRSNSLKTLAEKQTAALNGLDSLAEEIRQGLAAAVEPTAITERTPLPPVLHHRVATLMADFTALQKDAGARVDAIMAGTRELPVQINYRFEGDGLKFVVVPSRGGRGSRGAPPTAPSPETLARINEIRTQFSAVAEDYGQRVAALINEREAIRIEIGRTLGQAKATAIDGALFKAMRVVTAKETEGQYRDYRLAVFQPGLSPGQRRLLFDDVMEQLQLPLPRGELQPVGRGNSW